MADAAPPLLDADLIAAYHDCIQMFIKAHQTIAENGGQIFFDVAPGGDLLTAKASQNFGKCKVSRGLVIKKR